jgi:signal transduction histidine kinase
MAAVLEAATSAWPIAATMACGLTVERLRRSRRREALNRALHELRRPLQTMALMRFARDGAVDDSRPTGSQLDLALVALSELDAEVNGRRRRATRRPIAGRSLVEDAVRRWRSPAAVAGRRLELRWRAGSATVLAEPAAISRALDNLIANSLEHGARCVRLEGTAELGRLRVVVADGMEPGEGTAVAGRSPSDGVSALGWQARGHERDPRRGHGLAIAAGVAHSHGGRFALHRHAAGATAVLELPLAR